MANWPVISVSIFIWKLSCSYISRYKNQPPACVLMNFSFALVLQFFFTSHSVMLQLLVSTFRNYTIISVFWICTGKYCSRLMCRRSFSGWCDDKEQYRQNRSKKQLLLYLLPKSWRKEKAPSRNGFTLYIISSLYQGTITLK